MIVMDRNQVSSWCYGSPLQEDNLVQGNYSRWNPCCCFCQVPCWCGWGQQEPNGLIPINGRNCCKCDNDINIDNTININLEAEANGGDANGGDGGNAKGGHAAAANAESEFGGDAEAIASIGRRPNRSYCYGRPLEANEDIFVKADAEGISIGANNADGSSDDGASEELNTLNNGLGLELGASVAIGEAAAAGGSASGGDGGNGGAGGNGGTVEQSVTASIENVIVIECDGINGPPAIRLGQNDRTIDINVDKDGNTLVNGVKMEETELDDGTKVLIVRNNEVKKNSKG